MNGASCNKARTTPFSSISSIKLELTDWIACMLENIPSIIFGGRTAETFIGSRNN